MPITNNIEDREFHIGDRVVTNNTVMKKFQNKIATIVEIMLSGRAIIHFDDIADPVGSDGWSAPLDCISHALCECVDTTAIEEFIDNF